MNDYDWALERCNQFNKVLIQKTSSEKLNINGFASRFLKRVPEEVNSLSQKKF